MRIGSRQITTVCFAVLCLSLPGEATELATPGTRVAILDFFNLSDNADYDLWETHLGRGLRRSLFVHKEIKVIRFPLILKAVEEAGIDSHYITPNQVPPIATKIQADLVVLGSYNVVGGVIAASLKIVDGKTGKTLKEDTRFGYEDQINEFLRDLDEGLMILLFGEVRSKIPDIDESPPEIEDSTPEVVPTPTTPPPPTATPTLQGPPDETGTGIEPDNSKPEVSPSAFTDLSPSSDAMQPFGQTDVEVEGPVSEPFSPPVEPIPTQPAPDPTVPPAVLPDRPQPETESPSEPLDGSLQNALDQAWQQTTQDSQEEEPVPQPPGPSVYQPAADTIGPFQPPPASPEPDPFAPTYQQEPAQPAPPSQPLPGSAQPFTTTPGVQPPMYSPLPPVGTGTTQPQISSPASQPYSPTSPMPPMYQFPPPAMPQSQGPQTRVNPIEVEVPPLQASPTTAPENVQSPFQPMPAQPAPPPPQQPLGYPYVPPQNQGYAPQPQEEKPRGIRRIFSWFGETFGPGRNEEDMPPPQVQQPGAGQSPPRQETERKKFLWIFDRKESDAGSRQPSQSPASEGGTPEWSVQTDGFVKAQDPEGILVASIDPVPPALSTDVPLVSSSSSPSRTADEVPRTPEPEKAVSPFPGTKTMADLGKTYFESGNYDLAEDSYRKALSTHPNNPDLHFNLAQVCLAQGKDAEAIAAFERSASLNPNDSGTIDRLGAMYAEKGEWGKAVDTYTRLALLDPSKARTFVKLGLAFDMAGNPRQSIRSYQKALSIDPKNAEAARNIASVYLKLGRQQEAQPYLQIARAADPETRDLDRLQWLAKIPPPSKHPTRGTLFTR